MIDRELTVPRAQEAFDSSGALGDLQYLQQQARLAEIVATLVAEACPPARPAA